ncbi:MAG: hypothetical protein ACLP8V_05330 [Thermoplasmata archaeon]
MSENRLPAPSSRPNESRWYLLLSVGVIGGALAVLYWGYAQSALPPGGDPGHWIATANAFLGRPYPSADFTLHPFLYPPMIFVVVGGSLLATGSPVTAGLLVGGVLLAVYGITLIHLSRRYLVSGPFQFLFVGLAILNGTTLQILFWGGYPNLLGLALINEGLVFLLAFTKSRSIRDALILYGIAGLIYLTHDLTFAIFLVILLTTAVFLVFQDRRWFRLIFSWANLGGLALLGGIVGIYSLTTYLAGIPHPGYLFANPATFTIDNLGEFFRPLGFAPLWIPAGNPVTLSPGVTVAILVGAAVAIAITVWVVRRLHPAWVPPRLTLAGAAVVAALLLPIGGYLAHIDTDYTRFVYFLPLPMALLVSLLAERLLRPWLLGRDPHPAPGPQEAATPGPGTRSVSLPRPRPRPVRVAAMLVAIAIGLAAIGAEVSLPTVALAEQPYTAPIHDTEFVQALDWLKANTTGGAVLVPSGDALRWVEAIANRNALGPGPTWLDFYAAQVLGSQEAGIAWNSQYSISDNRALIAVNGVDGVNWSAVPGELAFAGGTATNATVVGAHIGQGPMYSIFVNGITVPILRIQPSLFDVVLQHNTTTVSDYGSNWTAPTLQIESAPTPRIVEDYVTQYEWLNETATIGPGAQATVSITATPFAGWQIHFVKVGITEPNASAMLTPFLTPSLTGPPENFFEWTVAPLLGQLSTGTTLATAGSLSVKTNKPEYGPGGAAHPTGYILNFSNPNLRAPFSVTLSLSTNGTSNPATVFPSVFNAAAYLNQNDVQFALLQNTSHFLSPFVFLEADLGFTPVYESSEWWILAR